MPSFNRIRNHKATNKNSPLGKKTARQAFLSWLKSYSTFPRSLKPVFNIKALNTGHVATSFCLAEAPSRIASDYRSRIIVTSLFLLHLYIPFLSRTLNHRLILHAICKPMAQACRLRPQPGDCLGVISSAKSGVFVTNLKIDGEKDEEMHQ